MAKSRSGAETRGMWWILPVVVLLVLLVVAGCGAYGYWQRREAERRAGEGSATTQGAGDLTSDERIIFGGVPRAKGGGMQITVLRNAAYMVGYSESRKDPLWSAYRVIKKEHPVVLERPKGDFLTDMRTRAQVTHHDFTGSGYDRGHMTPNSAIARCYGAEAQRETFFMSNVCPQAPALNQKVWEKLEKDEIEYANRFGEVWVMDGPVFGDVKEGAVVKKVRSGVSVPAAFFKILLEDGSGGKGQKARAFAVIMPQGVKGTELPGQFLRSIKEVEEETGLEFLWKVEPGAREELKGKVGAMWEVGG